MITMTRAATFVTVPTESFAWWLRRNRVPWPAPLNGSPAARVEIDLDELIAWREEDGDRAVRVTNEVNSRMAMKFPDAWSPPARTAAESVAAVLERGEWLVFAVRAEAESQSETFAAGVSDGVQGACVIDDGTNVSFASVEATEISVSMAQVLAPQGAKASVFRPFTMSKNAAAGLGGGPGSAAAAFKQARVEEADAALLTEVEARATAGGVIGAAKATSEGTTAGPVGAQWLESPAGGVLTLGNTDGSVTFDPLSVTSLTRALASAVAAVQ